ncbi:transposable element Tcb1 transposase [Trichonephila clavipes]|nr:transposable element Tcb1 transposase [Trichonephila clavipes]
MCCKDYSRLLYSPTHATLPWPAYSPDMSPIEHWWDLIGRSLARHPRPAASKDELLLRIHEIWNSLSQADIQNLLVCREGDPL